MKNIKYKNTMYQFFKNIFKDKTGNDSLREVVIGISMLLIVASWIAQLVFDIATPEYMFYSIVSLVAAGCFGYSLEENQPILTKKYKNGKVRDQINNNRCVINYHGSIRYL